MGKLYLYIASKEMAKLASFDAELGIYLSEKGETFHYHKVARAQ